MDAFMFPLPINPEELEKIKDQHEMMALDFRHGVQSLFLELSEEHLQSLRGMLHTIATESSDARLPAYWEGIAAAQLHARFGYCMGCNVNHDKQAEEALANPDGKKAEQKSTPPELTPEQFKNMQEYGLDDVRDADTLKLIGFKCINCSQPYQSIEDRMLRPPGIEGCGGCIQKAKWG